MGQKSSSPQTDRERRLEQHEHEKGAVEVTVTQSRRVDKKPIIKVPSTNMRILHVDPSQRAGIVPEHGYVALEYVPSWRRKTMESNALASNATSFIRHSMQSGGAGSEAFGYQQDAPSDDEDGVDRRRSRLEDGFGHGGTAEGDAAPPDVPVTARGGGINDDPASPHTLEQTTAMPPDDTQSQTQTDNQTEVKLGSLNMTPSQTLEMQREGQEREGDGSSRRVSENQQGAPGDHEDPFGRFADNEGMEFSDQSPSRRSQGRGSGEDLTKNTTSVTFEAGAKSSESGGAFKSGELMAVKREYVVPLGPGMNDRVYFSAPKTAADFDFNPSLDSKLYELEEDELHEMAGVRRVNDRGTRKTSRDDAFATYEVQSGVLDALRLAIEAPMKDFRVEETMPDEDEEGLADFRKRAMDAAKDMFDTADNDYVQESVAVFGSMAGLKQHPPGLDFNGTLAAGGGYGSARAGSATPRGRRSNNDDVTVVPPIGADLPRDETYDDVPGITMQTSQGVFPAGAEVPEQTEEKTEKQLEQERKKMIKRRKQLHKELNAWKAAFEAANGRGATAIELSNDPSIRDVYKEYIHLKKLTTSKAAQAVDETDQLQTSANNNVPQLGGTLGVAAATLNATNASALSDDPFTGSINSARLNPIHSPGLLTPGGHTPNHLSPLNGELPFDGVAGVSDQPFDGVQGITPVPTELTKEQKKEMKQLAKVVKAWKLDFKKETGRNPTRREISGDPTIAEQYLRLKELKALSGEGDEDEAAKGGRRKTGVLSAEPEAPPPPQLSPEEIEQALLDTVAEEDIERRNAEADETFARKALARRIKNMPLPSESDANASSVGKMDVDNLDTTTSNVRMADGADGGAGEDNPLGGGDAEPHSTTQRKTIAGWGGGEESTEKTPEEELADKIHRRTEIVFQLKDWDVAFVNNYQRAPTMKDLRLEQELYELYSELQVLPKDPNDPDNDYAVDQMKTSYLDESNGAHEGMDPKALAKRRKELGKELNAWKAQFAQVHQREPTSKDIKADPEIAGIFEEYQSIPKDIGKRAVAGDSSTPAGGGGGGGGSLSRSLSNLKQPKTPGDGSSRGSTDQLKRKKQLGKELTAWKANFAENEGREPTSKDIKKDPVISSVYEEYKALSAELKEKGNANDFNGTQDRPPPAATPDVSTLGGGGNAKMLQKRRKQLGKQLNTWKAEFAAANGRQPTTRDMKQDPEIAVVYEEYQSIPKDGGAGTADGFNGTMANGFNGTFAAFGTTVMEGGNANATVVDVPPAEIPVLNVVPSARPSTSNSELKNLKKKKKKLGKELNSWKADFEEATGSKPKTDDIKRDEQIAPLYEEYLALNKEIEALENGSDNAGLNDTGTIGAADTSALSSIPPASETSGMMAGMPEQSDVSAEQHDLPPPPSPQPEPGSDADLAKRRKELGKMLSGWKAEFTEAKGRAPTNKDIKRDPEASQLFAEYQELKGMKGGGKGGGQSEAAVTEEGHNGITEVVAPQVDDAAGEVHNGGEGASPPPEPTPEDDGGEPRPTTATEDDAPRPSTAERKTLKKKLNKELNAWKEQFAEENGRNPKASDIQQFPEVFALYNQLQALKEAK